MKLFLTIALTCLPLLCFGAPTYTTYFNNTHTYTNTATAGTNFASRGVFTNGLTSSESTFTGVIELDKGASSAGALRFTGQNPSYGNLIQGDLNSISVVSNYANYNGYPGLEVLPNGSLFSVCYSGTVQLGTNSAIISQVSGNGGATWSAPSVVYQNGTNNVMAYNPEISLLDNGTLLMTFNKYNTGTSVSAGLFVMIGSVSGSTVTWGSPIAVTSGFTDATRPPSTASKALQLANGDILWPIYGYNTGDTRLWAAVIKSTDSGLTWGSQVTLANGNPGQQYNEANMVQLASGRIVCIVRHDFGTVGYARTISDDNGATWSAIANVLTVNVSTPGKPAILLLPSGGIFMICRTATPLWTGWTTSWDEGATWTAFEKFGTSGNQNSYASMVVKPDGVIGAVIGEEHTTPNSFCQVFYQDFIDGYAFADSGYSKVKRLYTENLTLYNTTNSTPAQMYNENGVITLPQGGIGVPANTQFAFYTGTAQSFRVGSGGFLGFGTAAPTTYLSQRPVFSGNSNPGWAIDFTAGAANEKLWEAFATTKQLNFRVLNDAASAAITWLTVNRTTTNIDSLVFPRGMIALGAATSSGVLLTNVGTTVVAKLGDNSADTKFQANDLVLSKTITAAATTGDQTINKASGSVNFAAAAQTITVTDSLVTANSVIMATVATDDATAKSCIAVPGSGSFVLKLNAAATAETRVQFLITN